MLGTIRTIGIYSLSRCHCRSNVGKNIPSTMQLRTLFVKPSVDFIPLMTNQDVVDKFTKSSGNTAEYSPNGVKEILERRRLLMELLPKDLKELPPRKIQDSFSSAIIPLSKNSELREKYVTASGYVRVGRLLEDMDVFSVWVCLQHIRNPKSEGKANPYSIVTGLVDSIHLSDEFEILPNEDIRMCGHVSWVGKSSLEVSIQLDQKDANGQWRIINSAVFLMVARNPINAGSALVNPLIGETPEEIAYIRQGEERSQKRKSALIGSLSRKPPNEEEMKHVHEVFMLTITPENDGWKSPKLPSNSRSMESTVLNTLFLCHPQYRNRYNKIFGGFIMRQAAELAYANAYLYATTRPKLLDIDDIYFKKPVDIGSIIRFRAMVGYVQDNYIHTPVMAEVINPETGAKDVTNVFQFTFIIQGGENPLPIIVPNTYQEAMTYLQSRRHFKEMWEQAKRN